MDLEQIFRAEYGRVVAGLVRRFGDIDLAEDVMSDALVVALERWPVEGVPPNPAAWLTTVANHKAIDVLRREKVREGKYAEAAVMTEPLAGEVPEPTGVVEDDRLRLIFTCCHPALALENRVALTLRLLGGLTVAEIAHAFLVPEKTMAQRITRAKAKVRNAKIPYRVPLAGDVPERLAAVTAVLHLIFNEGYLATGSDSDPIRADLCAEAIRLTRALRSLVVEPEPELDGLLALMLLVEARRRARIADGRLVTLPDQDRTLWDAALIDEGHALVRGCLARNRPGPYQLLAAVNAVHTDAIDASMTDWAQMKQLYDQLLTIAPTPLVALNRAVAVAELDGPEVALALMDRLEVAGPLEHYHAWHATRADLLRRMGRHGEAVEAYRAAIELAGNEAERAWLAKRAAELGHPGQT